MDYLRSNAGLCRISGSNRSYGIADEQVQPKFLLATHLVGWKGNSSHQFCLERKEGLKSGRCGLGLFESLQVIDNCGNRHRTRALACYSYYTSLIFQNDVELSFGKKRRYGRTRQRKGKTKRTVQLVGRSVVLAAYTAQSSAVAFPSFLPPAVRLLQEQAALDLAARIQRVPVHTSLSENPILTSCVIPSVRSDDLPPILLLHGFDSSLLEWRRTYPLLEAGGAECWAFDILGWGFSRSDPLYFLFPVNLPHNAADYGAVHPLLLQDLDMYATGISKYGVTSKREHLYEFWKTYVKKPVVLVGASLGGATAIDLALAHPDAVAKLVLIDAQGFAEGVGELANFPKFLAYAAVGVLKSVPLRSYANYLAFSRVTFTASMDAMKVGRLHCLMPGWADASVSFMLSGGYNVASNISKIQQQTLVIWGEKDKILPKENAERFKRELANSELLYIKEAGHLPHLEAPSQVAEVLLKFIISSDKS